MSIEIKQLRYFKRVSDAGSVSRAAAALSVAQPAVSRQIANLEDTLGTPLFFRNGRGVKLTDAGDQLYQHAKEILEAVRQAEQNVRDTVGVARGDILIGSTPTVVRYLAPELLKLTQRNHPELTLQFTEGPSGTVNEWLSNGTLDVAILHDATRTQHFLTEPLLWEELVLVTLEERSGTATLREVSNEDLVLPRNTHGLRLMLERAASQRRLPLNVVAEVDGAEATKAVVRAGLGATVMPHGALTSEDALCARAIVEPPLSRCLLLATSSQRPVSQTTRAVIQDLKAVVRQLTDKNHWPGVRRYQPGAERPPASPATLEHAA